MNCKKAIQIGTVLIALSGCTTAAQQAGMKLTETAKSSTLEFKACSKAVNDSPQYAPIVSKLLSPAHDYEPTTAQMANESTPTVQESKLLAPYSDDMASCRKKAVEKLRGVSPDLAAVAAEDATKREAIMVQLTQRKIAWGSALQQFKKLRLESERNLAVASEKVSKELQAMHQAELDSDARRHKAIQEYLTQQQMLEQRQQMLNAARMPKTINCDTFGSTTHCTQW